MNTDIEQGLSWFFNIYFVPPNFDPIYMVSSVIFVQFRACMSVRKTFVLWQYDNINKFYKVLQNI